jgi:hypothetical protein
LATKNAEIYKNKNQNYGNSYGDTYQKLGPIAGITPLCFKMDRLVSLIKNPDINKYESVVDTALDLANYCLMFVVEYNKDIKEKNDKKDLI